jgi:hypothetical protein
MIVSGAKSQDLLRYDTAAVRTGIELDGPRLEPTLPDRIWGRLRGMVESVPIFWTRAESMAHLGHTDQVTPLEIKTFERLERDDLHQSLLGARGRRREFKLEHIQATLETAWNLEAVMVTDLALGQGQVRLQCSLESVHCLAGMNSTVNGESGLSSTTLTSAR